MRLDWDVGRERKEAAAGGGFGGREDGGCELFAVDLCLFSSQRFNRESSISFLDGGARDGGDRAPRDYGNGDGY